MTKKIPDGKIKITEIDWQTLTRPFFTLFSKFLFNIPQA